MISKSRLKQISSLEHKRFRNESGLFLAEGPKIVSDFMQYFKPQYIAATSSWISANSAFVQGIQTDTVTEEELCRASLLKTPQQVLALFPIPHYDLSASMAQKELVLMLDSVQDPGNVGTIIRIADWFGIKNIICSEQTADAWAPKTVQATMGALARVHIHYTDLDSYIGSLPEDTPVYGTLLDGRNIYGSPLTQHGIIIMGNEGKGISAQIRKHINRSLYIPCYPADAVTSESLNVATATAIVCAEFRRQASNQ